MAIVLVGSLTAGAFSGKILEVVPYALVFGLAAGLASALVFALLGPALRVEVFEFGLRAPGFFPPPVSIRWTELEAIDRFSNAGGAYLRLHPVQGGRRAYLPIGLARQPDFCRLVAAQAGLSHPLVLVLTAPA